MERSERTFLEVTNRSCGWTKDRVSQRKTWWSNDYISNNAIEKHKTIEGMETG